jgi:hypothetical protein
MERYLQLVPTAVNRTLGKGRNYNVSALTCRDFQLVGLDLTLKEITIQF